MQSISKRYFIEKQQAGKKRLWYNFGLFLFFAIYSSQVIWKLVIAILHTCIRIIQEYGNTIYI